MHLTIKKQTNNPVEKWAENINRHLYTENMQTANKHIKRCSTSLQEMQINSKLQWAIPLHWSVYWLLYLEILLNSLVVTALWWCLYNLFIMYKCHLQTQHFFFPLCTLMLFISFSCLIAVAKICQNYVQKHQFFGAQFSLKSKSHIHTWLLEKTIALTSRNFLTN